MPIPKEGFPQAEQKVGDPAADPAKLAEPVPTHAGEAGNTGENPLPFIPVQHHDDSNMPSREGARDDLRGVKLPIAPEAEAAAAEAAKLAAGATGATGATGPAAASAAKVDEEYEYDDTDDDEGEEVEDEEAAEAAGKPKTKKQKKKK